MARIELSLALETKPGVETPLDRRRNDPLPPPLLKSFTFSPQKNTRFHSIPDSRTLTIDLSTISGVAQDRFGAETATRIFGARGSTCRASTVEQGVEREPE